MSFSLRIAISCGELSGDEHAAGVLNALKKNYAPVEARAMGGHRLKEAGAALIVDAERSAGVMGFADVVFALPRILAALRTMEEMLHSWRPDLLLLVDFPDFNFRLARIAKRLRIPVLYFIPPTIWAWREGRLALLKRYVDFAAVIYPFEQQFYEARGYDRVSYVGHPFIAEAAPDAAQLTGIRNSLHLSENDQPLVIFPGSRPGELTRHAPQLREAIRTLVSRHSNVRPIIAAAPSIDDRLLSNCFPPDEGVTVWRGNSRDLLYVGAAGLIKSGTSNLQAAFAGIPFTMFYIASRLSEMMVRRFVRVKEYSIVNIIRPGTIKELTQSNANAQALVREVEDLLFNQDYRLMVKTGLGEVVSKLNALSTHAIFEDKSLPYERVATLCHYLGSGNLEYLLAFKNRC